jgi:signal peptidase II
MPGNNVSEIPMTEGKLHRLVLPDLKAHCIFWSLFVGGLALDLWSKSAVFRWLGGNGRYPLINGLLRFVSRQNDGAAFNLFAGNTLFLVGISVVAMIVVVGVFLFGGARQRLAHIALGLFAGGICGNLYDRLFNGGEVRDFIEVYVRISGRERLWPAFNVADTLLCIGVGLLIISTVTAGKSDQKRAQQRK